MSILSDFIDLVNATITDKTANYSITPQNVGNRITELATLVPQLGGSVPLGTIIMYAPATTAEFDGTGLGIASNVLGWAICNGANDTPDMRSKFVVGYNPSDSDYDTIGETGGQKYVTEVLKHNHLMFVDYTGTPADGDVSATGTAIQEYSFGNDSSYDIQGYNDRTTYPAALGLTSDTGVTQPDNRPPYYTVLYLKKIV